MSNHTQEGHLMEVLRRGLEEQLKERLTEYIVKKELTEYEQILREQIKPMVEAITVPALERFENFMNFRNELHVVVHFEEKK